MESNATNTDNGCAGVLLNESLSIEGQGPSVLPVMTAIKFCIGVTGLAENSLVVFIMYKYRKLFLYLRVCIINQRILDGVANRNSRARCRQIAARKRLHNLRE